MICIGSRKSVWHNKKGNMMGLFSVGQLADRFDEPVARVSYVIQKLGLKPRRRIGIHRLFDQSQATAIKEGLMELEVHVRREPPSRRVVKDSAPRTTIIGERP